MTMPAPQFEIDDRRYDPQAWVPASRKRRLLALYIDYLIVGSLWVLVQYLVTRFAPAVGDLPAWGRWALFGLFELTATRFDGIAPGARVLSMRRFSYRGAEGSGRPLRGRLWFVDAWVKRNESWLSMIAAFLFVSDGVKSAVRWTMWNPPQPLFGMALNDFTSTVAYIGMGGLEVWLGYLLFTLHRRAAVGALAYTAGLAVSVVTSWNLWDPFLAEMITRRHAYLGTGRAAERVQAFQAIMPEALVAGLALLLGLLIVLAVRYKKLPARQQNRERVAEDSMPAEE